MNALRQYECWLYGAPEMRVKVVTINSTSGNPIEIVGVHGFEPDKDDNMVLPDKYCWDHSMFNWDVRTHPIAVTWVWYEKEPNDTEVSFSFGVGGEIPKTGIKINASVAIKLTKNDDPIFSQIVNWHDKFPKTYNNGLFYFTLRNE